MKIPDELRSNYQVYYQTSKKGDYQNFSFAIAPLSQFCSLVNFVSIMKRKN